MPCSRVPHTAPSCSLQKYESKTGRGRISSRRESQVRQVRTRRVGHVTMADAPGRTVAAGVATTASAAGESAESRVPLPTQTTRSAGSLGKASGRRRSAPRGWRKRLAVPPIARRAFDGAMRGIAGLFRRRGVHTAVPVILVTALAVEILRIQHRRRVARKAREADDEGEDGEPERAREATPSSSTEASRGTQDPASLAPSAVAAAPPVEHHKRPIQA